MPESRTIWLCQPNTLDILGLFKLQEWLSKTYTINVESKHFCQKASFWSLCSWEYKIASLVKVTKMLYVTRRTAID
jgi:hypothetical protein